MSMLSAQIDKLRALADRMDGIVPNTPDELRDAADTIWQLRDDLQRTNAENAKLRELVLQLWECPVDDNKCTDCPHCKEHYDVCAGECGCKLYDRMRELGVDVSA